MKNILVFIFVLLIIFLNSFTFSKVLATSSNTTKPLRITEINWAGSSYGPNDEWIEVQNVSNEKINLKGYFIRGITKNRDIQLDGVLPAHEYFLIAKKDPTKGNSALKTKPDLITGISIHNEKFHISIIYKENGKEILVDEVNTSNSSPFAGTNSSLFGKARASMERINPEASGNIPSNWKTAEFSVNLRPKTNNSESIIDLGSPKAASTNFTEIPLSEIILEKTNKNTESVVPVDASFNDINLFTLKSNITKNKKYNIQVTSEATSTQYNSTIELKTTQNNQITSEKQFINGKNTFTYITDNSQEIEISATIHTNSLINLKSLRISGNETNLNEILIDTKNSYSDGQVINGQFSLNSAQKVLISKSLNEITDLSKNKNVIFSSKIKVHLNNPNADILEVRAINKLTNYQSVRQYNSDDLINNFININFDILVPQKGNTFLEIINLTDNELFFSEGTISLFDGDKFEENINIAKFIKDKTNTTKTDFGLKINNYESKKAKFSNIELCKYKSSCKVSFVIKNNSSHSKFLRIAFGYKNNSEKDYHTQYFELKDLKRLEFSIKNKNEDVSQIQIIISGDINNIEISNIKAISDNNAIKFLNNKTANIGVYKNHPAQTHGFKGQLNDIFETNTLQAGKYRFRINISSNKENLTSNFSIVRINAYDRIGRKLFEENITEKELKNMNGLFLKDFELKRDSKVIFLIKYFGTHKKGKADIEISDPKIENIP